MAVFQRIPGRRGAQKRVFQADAAAPRGVMTLDGANKGGGEEGERWPNSTPARAQVRRSLGAAKATGKPPRVSV